MASLASPWGVQLIHTASDVEMCQVKLQNISLNVLNGWDATPRRFQDTSWANRRGRKEITNGEIAILSALRIGKTAIQGNREAAGSCKKRLRIEQELGEIEILGGGGERRRLICSLRKLDV